MSNTSRYPTTLQESCNVFFSQMDGIHVLTDEEKKQLGYLLNKVHLWSYERADEVIASISKELEENKIVGLNESTL